jgi:hypothetical protein
MTAASVRTLCCVTWSLIVATACGDDIVKPRLNTHAGRFALQFVDGSTPPATVTWNTRPATVHSVFLELDESGGFCWVAFMEAQQTPVLVAWEGNAIARGDSVALRARNITLARGAFSGDLLELQTTEASTFAAHAWSFATGGGSGGGVACFP